MGWDIFCCICGNSCKGGDFYYLNELFGDRIDEKNIKNIAKDIKWMNSKITLFANNKIKKCGYDCEYENHLPMREDMEYGILLHYNCWKFVKINYGIELKYKNLPINNNNNLTPQDPILININYDKIAKYWKQDMDLNKMYDDDNMYMLQNPLIISNTKNITRIKKIITQLKLKKELRPSPSVSATFYKDKTIKIGNNNKFWIIKNGKWNEIKEDIIKKQFEIKSNYLWKLNFLPQIGDYSIIPLFLNNTKEQKNSIIELIGTHESIEQFENNKTIKQFITKKLKN